MIPKESLIQEIEIKPIKIFTDKEGHAFETIRSDDKIFEGKFGQNFISTSFPGVIKGLHKHDRLTEYTTCIGGNILYIAIKETPEGPIMQKILMGEDNMKLVKNPPGIWHGYIVLPGKDATVLYTMDTPYDPNQVDQLTRDTNFYGDIWTNKQKSCRICNSPLSVFLNLGKAPISNLWLSKEEIHKDVFRFNLEAAFCTECKMVQLTEFVPYEKYIIPTEPGKTEYSFYSSTSDFMITHFSEYAKEIEDSYMENNDLVVEIGGNDGIMLQAFSNNIRKLNIEPGTNVAEVARIKGIESWTDFFTEDLAKKIVSEKGKAKSIISANVILNIGDLHELLKGVNTLLDDEGVFVFQDPYMPKILERNSFDQFYDEHIYYFSATSLSNLLKMHGLEIFNLSMQDVHGGSMRVYVKKISSQRQISDSVQKFLDKEKDLGLDKLETYEKFAGRVSRIKNNLNNLLDLLKQQNKKIVGYAATCKSSTVFTYCNIGPDKIDYISDSTPDKQGKLSPGKHIPIVTPDFFHKDNPEYTLLLAWNHEKEIIQKESEYLKNGGKFITFNPEVRII
jgi:methylation protein EvaC